MKSSPEKFAELLTEAVYRIRLLESKPLQVVQDELGYALGRSGGSPIDYWRRGKKAPTRLADLEKLTQELLRRSGLDETWAATFVAAAGFPEIVLSPNSGGNETLSETRRGTEALPRNLYRHLVGRQTVLTDILEALEDKNGRWCVGIDGLGGIGKTAVALDVTKRCQEQRLFPQVVWLSAATQSNQESSFTIETILDGIGQQLGLPDVVKLPHEEKAARLQAILTYSPVLIVLDNLETAKEPQAAIVEKLRPFLNPTKLLLTSRKRFSGQIYTVHLGGLEMEQAVTFIQQDAAEKGIDHIKSAASKELEIIANVTGGSPLAIKLVVSQIAYLPLPAVLAHLQQVTPLQHVDDSGEYINFYRFVFFHSWSLLNEEGKQLLVAMARFDPANGCHMTALQHISNLPQATLVTCIDHLWRLSLLEIGEVTNLHQLRYYLHPLTQYFVLSDIVQIL